MPGLGGDDWLGEQRRDHADCDDDPSTCRHGGTPCGPYIDSRSLDNQAWAHQADESFRGVGGRPSV